jgi:dTDP-4-dehydrorhamnose reductase
MKKTAVVAGSTGLVGKHLVKLLAESTAFNEVTALVRSGSSFIHEDVFTEEVDYARLAEHIDTLKADAVFCCLGTTMKKAGSKAAFHKVDFDYPFGIGQDCCAAGQSAVSYHHGIGGKCQIDVLLQQGKGGSGTGNHEATHSKHQHLQTLIVAREKK